MYAFSTLGQYGAEYPKFDDIKYVEADTIDEAYVNIFLENIRFLMMERYFNVHIQFWECIVQEDNSGIMDDCNACNDMINNIQNRICKLHFPSKDICKKVYLNYCKKLSKTDYNITLKLMKDLCDVSKVLRIKKTVY